MNRPDRQRLAAVRVVITDVDGVLTDGSLYYGEGGETLKVFHVRDGAAIVALRRAGVVVAAISGRDCAALRARLDDLGVTHRWLGCSDKAAAVDELLGTLQITDSASVLAVGDDLQDAPLLERAGIAVAVADAELGLRARADWVTQRPGGHGAFREIADALLDARTAATGFRVVIPSRYGATRLPGKPMRDIAGRPMIAHVCDRGRESGAFEVIVAADDDRIRAAVEAAGGICQMTSPDHLSGTDRIAEVARTRGWAASDIIVNLQGDEPALPGELVRTVAAALEANPWAAIATLATPITSGEELVDSNTVKVTIADNGRALSFSRAPMPWVRDAMSWGETPRLPADVPFLRHIGLYAYRVGDLLELADTPPVAIETAESLEQLRALVHGLDIHVTKVGKAPPNGVDTENDLARIERYMTHST